MARVIRRRYLGGAAATLGGVLAAACGEVEIRYVQGPAGPAGPAGVQGAQGAAGSAGAKGSSGAAGQTIVVEKEKPVVVEKVVEKVVTVEKPVVVEKVVEKVVEVPVTSSGPKRVLFDTDWGPDGPRGEVVKRSLALYKEQRPEVTVDVRFSAGREQAKSNSVFARTAVLIAADDMGDLFLWAAYVFVYWAKRGLFADLTPYLKQFKVAMDDYVSIPQHEIYPYPNGKVFGWPFQVITRDWMYNKSILDRHGIEPNENWTFDDLINAARQVQEPDNNIYGMPAPAWWNHVMTMYQIGGDTGAHNGEYYLFNSPAGIQAGQFWEDIVHKHQVAPTPQVASEKKLSTAKGNYAFFITYPSAAFRKAVGTNFEFDFMYAPKWPANGERAVSQQDQAHMVTKWAGTRGVVAESAELAAHLAGPETSDIILTHGNTPPTWKALFDSDRNIPSDTFRRDILMDGFNYRYVHQAHEWWYPMARAWRPVINKVWAGEISYVNAAQEADRLNKLIAGLRTLHPTSDVLQAKL